MLISITDTSSSGASLGCRAWRSSPLRPSLWTCLAAEREHSSGGPGLADVSLRPEREKGSSPSPPAWKPHRELYYLGGIIRSTPGQACGTERPGSALRWVPTSGVCRQR